MPKKRGRRGSSRRGGWLHRQLRRRPRPAWVLALAHIAVLGIALVIYALPHHVLPSIEQDTGITSSRVRAHTAGSAQPAGEAAKAEALFADSEALEEDDEDPFAGDGAPQAVEVPTAGEGVMVPVEKPEETAEAASDTPEDAAPEAGDDYDADAEPDFGDEDDEAWDDIEDVAADFSLSEGLPDIDAEDGGIAGPVAAAQDPVGSFRNKFADKFTDGEVIKTNNSYQSANIYVTFQKKYFEELQSRIYFVDIYVADISCLRTVLAKDTYGRGHREWITTVAKRTKSIATMNGDFYGSRGTGVVVRNGRLYRDAKNIRDVAVLYWDGTFETIAPKEFDAKTAIVNGAYQCWHFGPRLLDDEGHAMTEFNADKAMVKRQPRSAFGYFEPGHYCFVVVDGRHEESYGIKMADLSKVMESLGCAAGYNMDGGQTSLLAKGNKLLNRPDEGGRNTSDFIIVVDKVSN